MGRGAVISPDAEIGEPDLVTVGRAAAVDPFARVRGFVAAGGAMRLSRVKVGAGATMCVRSSAVRKRKKNNGEKKSFVGISP